MPRYWVGVVHRGHVLRGVEGGFAQLSHGKLAPLERMLPGDWLIYYSPKTGLEGESLMAFTALGQIADRPPYPGAMAGATDFTPMRRDVDYLDVRETPIRPLLDTLDLTRGHKNWGIRLRAGLVGISAADFAAIRAAMIPAP